MLPDSIAPYEGPLLALLLGFGAAALLRGRGGWPGLALPLAALAGFLLVLGGMNASPRQVFERLPMLAAGALVLAVPLAALPRTWLAVTLALLAGVGTGWWMAGAPMVAPDLRRGAAVLLVLALLVPVLFREGGGAWRGQVATLALLAGIWAAAPPGPWWLLALTLAAATLPLLVAGAALPDPARLGLAMLLAALALGPVLTRGAPQDWAAALAPLAALLLGPRAGKGVALAGLAAAAAVPVAAAWWLARG
jgi:hypothetical protein